MRKLIVYFTFLQLMLCNQVFGQATSWEKTNSPSIIITALTVSSDGIIFAGSNDGTVQGGTNAVYRSSDDGQTWADITNGLSVGVEALSLDSNGQLWAGTAGAGIFKSENNGDTWTRRLSGGLIWDISFSSKAHIFAGTHGSIGLGFGGIQRSLDNGQTWQRLANGLLTDASDFFTLAIAANDILYAGGRIGLYRSEDNGDNWQILGLDSFTVTAIAINANGDLFVATNSDGLYHSIDGGTTFELINNGLNNLNLQALALSSDGDLFAGTFGNGVFLLPAGSSNWQELSLGLSDSTIRALAFSPADILYAGTNVGVFKNESFVTSVDEPETRGPTSFRLMQNYPNPFNPATTIVYDLPADGLVELRVYNLRGQAVRTLVNQAQAAGAQTVVWDGRDNLGRLVGSGIYMYTLEARDQTILRKMLLIK